MTTLLTKVRTRARLHGDRRAWQLLDGSYASVHSERSLDFDDLREYVPGDSPRDIDWKATARSHTTLVRRSIATRRHQVWLVVDTGRSMAAHTTHEAPKRDLAVTAAGVLGSIAQQHGDVVGLVSGDRAGSVVVPPRSGDAHLERMLRQVHDATALDAAPTSPSVTWGRATRAIRRRAVVVLIGDDHDLADRHQLVLRQLRARHTVLHLTVGDLAVGSVAPDARAFDVADRSGLARFARTDRRLLAELHDLDRSRRAATTRLLDGLGIRHATLAHPDDAVRTLLELLTRGNRGH